MNCLNCGVETDNPKFCSRSCSATYNGKVCPKRKITRKCSRLNCDNLVKTTNHRLCSFHSEESKNQKNKYKYFTIGSYREMLSVKGKHPSWINCHIRNFTRQWLKHLTELPCKNCGYSLHVELCHIKPVSSFPDSTLLLEVNSEQNVVQLCRNCHWEFDNGFLKIEDLIKEI